MRTTSRPLLVLLLLLVLLVGVGGALRWWPTRPRAEWDVTADTLVLEIASHPLEGGNYQPQVQLWGDGRIIWQQTDSTDGQQFMEGRLTPEAMRQVVERIIAAGAFDPMLDLGGGVIFQYLHVNLRTHRRCVYNTDDRMERILQADAELFAFLYAGAGSPGGRPTAKVMPESDCR